MFREPLWPYRAVCSLWSAGQVEHLWHGHEVVASHAYVLGGSSRVPGEDYVTSQKTSEWEAISRSYKAHLVNLQLIKGKFYEAHVIYTNHLLNNFFFVAAHHHSSKSSRQGFRACHCTTCCRNSRYQLLSVNTIIPWGYHSSRYFWAGINLVQFIVHLRLVSSLGRAPVCWAGGRGFKSRPDQHSGSFNNWE